MPFFASQVTTLTAHRAASAGRLTKGYGKVKALGLEFIEQDSRIFFDLNEPGNVPCHTFK